MKYGKTLMLALMLMLLVGGIVSAAELRVLKTGTGKGMVIGGEIYCGSDCKWTYEEKTVVQLKAIPYSNSRFSGWLVNGKPGEGVIMIDQNDIVVTAIFESKSERDNLIIQWYNGSHNERAIMVLDEVAVFIEPWEKCGIATQDDFMVAVQEIIQRFHPQAFLSAQFESYLILKSPEPIEKDHLLSILPGLKEFKYVRQVSPIFYVDPTDPVTQLILTDEIIVRFPDKYTDAQVQAIETAYELVRIKSFGYAPNGFIYRVRDPLEALDLANRLYESGQVEYAYPNWLEEMIPLSNGLNDTYFSDQWNLKNWTCGHNLSLGGAASTVSLWALGPECIVS